MTNHQITMQGIFDRLFIAEGRGGDAFPAQIQFRSGYAIQGVVARDGSTLKMAVPSMIGDPRYPNNQAMAKKIMAEHFFDFEDVESVIVIREVDASKLVGDNASGPKIILGGQ